MAYHHRRHFRRHSRGYHSPEATDTPAQPITPMIELMQHPTIPAAARELQTQKDALAKIIQPIKNRLLFGYSEPLHKHYMELVRQDLVLSQQLAELLLALPKQA